jgi:ubiquinone/menaquinone biosynthesis C-methylase UbiE
MALPFPGDAFDAAIMALVIFFVPDPAKGVAEMARVVRPGGIVAAYAWDVQFALHSSSIMVVRRAL